MENQLVNQINNEAERDQSIGGIVITREEMSKSVKELSVLNNWQFLWALAIQWIVIGCCIALFLWSNHWLTYLIAFVVIATRQHALGILMHEGTHYRCLTNRTANDVVCDLFCALQINMMTSRYKYEHILHHRYLNTDRDPYWLDFKNDPDWHWPKRPISAIWVFVRDLLGLNTLRLMPTLYRWSPWINHFTNKTLPPPLTTAERVRFYLFLIAQITLLTLTHSWLMYLILWQLPLMTLTTAMMRLRTIGEHLAIPNKTELDASRHTEGSLIERLSIAPLNINYHIEHHLFPSVPFYNLPKLYKVLKQNKNFQEHIIFNKTYLGFKENELLGQIILH